MQPRADAPPSPASPSEATGAAAWSQGPLAAPRHGPRQATVPMALGAALVLQSVAYFLAGIRFATLEYVDLDFSLGASDAAYQATMESLRRWSLLSTAIPFVALALAIGGGFELVRRTRGSAHRGVRGGARLVLGALIALFAIAVILEICYRDTSLFPEISRFEETWRWMRRASVTGWLLVSVGALACGWQVRGVRRLALPLVAVTLLAYPYDLYSTRLYAALLEVVGQRYYSLVFGTLFDASHVALLLLVLRRGAPLADPGEGWWRVAAALERAHKGFMCRLALIVLGSVITLWSTFLPQTSGEVREAERFWIPLCCAAVGLLAVSGVVGAAGLMVRRAPRALLYSAAAVMLAELALSTTRVWVAWAGPDVDHAQSLAQALPWILPMLSVLGVVLVSHGLHRIATLLPSPELEEQARASRVVVIVCQPLVLGAPYLLSQLPATAGLPSWVVVVVVVIVSFTTQFSLAHMCLLLAKALRARAKLPTAKIVSR